MRLKVNTIQQQILIGLDNYVDRSAGNIRLEKYKQVYLTIANFFITFSLIPERRPVASIK